MIECATAQAQLNLKALQIFGFFFLLLVLSKVLRNSFEGH
jgi:hypothetical protein